MATRNGTPGNDTLTGTASADSIFGFAGNDKLQGLAGSDRLFGGRGSDSVFGGTGRDRLFGGKGNFSDYLDGGDGDDRIKGDDGNDNLIGGTGKDQLFGDKGNDRIRGGDGNDTLTGSTTNLIGERDTLTGGTGADLFILGNANQIFYNDRNTATAGTRDYALVTDFNPNKDVIQLKGTSDNYVLAPSPEGLPAGTAIYLNKLSSEPDELIAIVPGSTSLSLEGDYFNFTAEFDLADLNGSNGFKINGISAGDGSGGSVSSAGDVNGDGFADLIIGAASAAPNGLSSAGESYVVFGKAGGFSDNFNLSALNGSNGFKINGIDALDLSGSSVSNAGDVNGDGFDDIIIGAPDADPNGQSYAGESYVVFGQVGGFSDNFNLSTLNGSNGFQVNGINEFDFSGSVSSAGDVNGDGFDDVIIGASNADPNGQTDAGESYVVFGKAGGFSDNLNLSALNGSNGFKINGIDARDRSGASVSSAGDVNGDGFDDLIIGAAAADPNGQSSAGESYVVFGKAGGFSANLNLSALNGSNGFKINGIDARDRSGASVSSAGDVNGDGFDDLIIGTSFFDPYGQSSAGGSYVVFGKAGGFSANLNISTLNGSNGFKINGIDVNGGFFSGTSVSSAGDVSEDGFDDIIIGARDADPNGQFDAGESYVIFGCADFTAATLNIGTLEPFDQLLTSNTGNSMMSTRQDRTLGSTTTADSIFFDPHSAKVASLLVGTDITQIIT